MLADEDLQQAEFGLDPLVLSVRLQHRHPVLLLNISKRGTRADRVVRFYVFIFQLSALLQLPSETQTFY